METGLYLPLRMYNNAEGKPELTDNDFYCKDYDHHEYLNLDPDENKILPFCVVLSSDALGEPYVSNTATLISLEDGSEYEITLADSDFVEETVGSEVYIFYKGVVAFTSTESIPCGRYHLELKIQLTFKDYNFYSDTFLLNKSYNPA